MDANLPQERRIGRNLAPPVPAEVKKRAKVALLDWAIKARARLGRTFDVPSISFDLKGRSVAGCAWIQENHIQLNAALLIANEARFASDVIPHELSHLLAHNMFGADIAPHGPEWRKVMRTLGVRASSTIDLPHRPGEHDAPGFWYICRCREIKVSTRRHNDLLRSGGRKVLGCQKCGTTFRWKDAPGTPRSVSQTSGQTSGAVGPVPDRREPSSRMLDFAEALARRVGVSLSFEIRKSFQACSAFIEKYKDAPTAPSSSKSPASGAAHKPVSMPATRPSEAQLRYARSIALRKNVVIPQPILDSKKLISEWIDANR